MRIVKFTGQDFLRLQAVEITPEGHLIEIRGKNAQGKSAVLHAISAALCRGDSLPDEPIRRGAEQAKIELDLGTVTVTRRFGKGKSEVTVYPERPSQWRSARHMLDSLIGAISFDPVEFSRMKVPGQFEELRKVGKSEVDLEALDGRYLKAYDDRTDVNRELGRQRGKVSGIAVPADLPSEKIDITLLTGQLRQVGEDNAALASRRAERQALAARVGDRRRRARANLKEVERLRQQANDLEFEASQLEREAVETDEAMAADVIPEDADTAALVGQIAAAQQTNAHIDRRTERETVEAEIKALEARVAGYTATMQDCARQKATAIAALPIPVPGLTLRETWVEEPGKKPRIEREVLYKDLPFSQASQAEKIRVSVAIAMAANPTLKVLCVHDGSLLDEDSLKLLSDLVKENDYQLWLEVTSSEVGKTGVLIEDGQVAAIAEKSAPAQSALALGE